MKIYSKISRLEIKNIIYIYHKYFDIQNYLTLFKEDTTFSFSSAPSTSWGVVVDYSNVIVFTFDFTKAVDITFIVSPIAQAPQTTTTPPQTTTPPYNGPYAFNPATTVVDLTVSIDASKTNQKFNECKTILQEIANTFSYDAANPNAPYARLSLFTFNPSASGGFGFTEPWALDNNTLSSTWETVKQIVGSNDSSQVFQQLNNNYFTQIKSSYPFRDNVQKVFLYCTYGE